MIRFALVLFYTILFTTSSVGWAQVRTKNLEVVDEKTTLSNAELASFKMLASQKVNELENYISTVGDKEQNETLRDLAIKNAEKLFIDTATIEVSRVVNGKVVRVTRLPVRQYFFRLKALPYKKVNITYYDVAYIRDYQKSANGNYVAQATIFQQFEGLDAKGRLRYKDKQAKNVTVLLTDLMDEFYANHRWTLRLGDIRLAETR
ncbi:hypothetical protein [Spirosoma jeollabukense]